METGIRTRQLGIKLAREKRVEKRGEKKREEREIKDGESVEGHRSGVKYDNYMFGFLHFQSWLENIFFQIERPECPLGLLKKLSKGKGQMGKIEME